MPSYHYVPVLRWKKGEVDALKGLEPVRCNSMMPLLQPNGYDLHQKLVKVSVKKMAERYFELMQKKVDELHKAWGTNPIFIDCEHLGVIGGLVDVQYMVNVIFDLCRKKGIPIVPVTGLERTMIYQGAIQSSIGLDSNGVAIRVGIDEMRRGSFNSLVKGFMSTYNVRPIDVDIILDLGLLPTTRNQLNITHVLQQISSLADWRSLIMVGGCFPKDLGDFSLGKNMWPR